MKTRLILCATAITFSLFVFQSCKKEAKVDGTATQFNEDNSLYKEENDQANDDVNQTVSDVQVIGGRIEGTLSAACGISSIETDTPAKKITIHFDGTTYCFSPTRTRAGIIEVQLTKGEHWRDAGSELTITFKDFKVTRSSNGRSITFNGTKTFTNVDGGNWFDILILHETVKYRERALNMSVTFQDGKHATWNSARVTTIKYIDAGLESRFVYTANGDTSIGGLSNVDGWGTTREGKDFTVNFNTPWESNTYCELWRPTSGDIDYNIGGTKFGLTLGVEKDGSLSTAKCAYGWKITWDKANGKEASLVFSY